MRIHGAPGGVLGQFARQAVRHGGRRVRRDALAHPPRTDGACARRRDALIAAVRGESCGPT
ncbi:hypothetical protein [Nocardia xishanensis]